MDAEVAAQAGRRIGEHAAAHGLPSVNVVLHGGEPLLAGPRHLARLLDAGGAGVRDDTKVRSELQTRGTLPAETWLDLFKRYEVTAGISLDGPAPANGRHRLTRRGLSSTGSAVRGVELLRTIPHLFVGLLAVIDLANDQEPAVLLVNGRRAPTHADEEVAGQGPMGALQVRASPQAFRFNV